MQHVFGFAAAFGCRLPAKSRSIKSTSLIMNGCLLLPLQHSKNLINAASKASCIQHFKTKPLGAGVVRARPPQRLPFTDTKF